MKTQEEIIDPTTNAVIDIAKRAKSYVRMLVLINTAAKENNPAAVHWVEQHREDIRACVAELKRERVEGEPLTIPPSIQHLFNLLPYGKKLKEAEARYLQYYEAWEGSRSIGVMLARLKVVNPKHGLSAQEQQDESRVRVALCDALSHFSETLRELEANKWYIV